MTNAFPVATAEAAGLYIGLMSGTSLDGVDGVLADLGADGQIHRVLAHHHLAFDAVLADELLALQAPGHDELHRAALAGNALAAVYASTVEALLSHARVSREHVRCVAAHGQTVRHRPDVGYTLQLLNAALLAELTSIPVVADFRSRDVAAGGQGAPLVPAFHRALFARSGQHRLIVNLGGICNLTFLDAEDQVMGYDIGPCNVLMDAWTQRHLGQPFDDQGAWASIGEVQSDLLEHLLDEPYFSEAPPKSTGRDHFNMTWLDQRLATFSGMAPEDVARTLVELVAQLIAREVAESRPRIDDLIFCGGGAFNLTLTRAIADAANAHAPLLRCTSSATEGVPPDQVEALAFAWLGYMHMSDQPGNLPDVTGADDFRVLGAYYPH